MSALTVGTHTRFIAASPTLPEGGDVMKCSKCNQEIGEYECFLVDKEHLTIHQRLDPSYPLVEICKYSMEKETFCLKCRNSQGHN